ncbi:EAL domain-containing protein [Methylobacillus arboreus]|uniref:EAL domain-containing protein n=1 Tax=Methylobacillus arboreus TaxID=755170 RepID=UPI001E511FFA|nr:EAL domain-containing protein [Methylobacillus arboreus]MCB5189836.1 EAL domain-containing protein [Methylobacillus arboreus]
MLLYIKTLNSPLPSIGETNASEDVPPAIMVYPCKDDRELLQTLDKIAEEYPEQLLDEAYVWYGQDGSHGVETLMAGVMPFNTFYARMRHPWLLDDLSRHVEMHFQPIVDFTQNGKIFGYEALCRLLDPDGNILTGEEAFRLARQVNRAVDLDMVCQDLALAGKASAIADGTPLFINVLPQTIMRGDWLALMLEALDRHGIEHRDVVIEIVESEEVSPDVLARHCDAIRTQGLRIALDDMGSGFNGLSTLAVVKADFIKIDRTIVHEAQGSRVRTVLLEAIISMAQRLGCTIVAEGLERVEDITYCQDLGLVYAQGYYFARPEAVPAQIVTALPARDEAHRSSIPDEFRISEFVSRGITIEVNTPIDQARSIFIDNPDVACAVVLDNLRPIGLLKRGKVFTYRNDALGNYCDPLPRMITSRMPSASLARGLYLERGEVEPWIMVSDDGVYVGIVHPLEIMSQIINRKTSSGNLHPLSHLTTGPTLRQSLDVSLRNDPNTQLVYIDLDHFKAYNDRYGFIRGDAMIRLLSEIVRQEFHNKTGVLVGHIGGDDFVLILDHEDPSLINLLLNVVSHFQTLAVHLYDSSDLERGFFTTEDGKDHPVASVSIAVVNGSQGRISNSVAAAERAASLKKIGKSNIGSIIVVESQPPRLIVPRSDEYSDWQSRALNALKLLQTLPRNPDAHCLDSCFADYPFFEVVFELNPDGSQRYANWINPNMYGKIKAGGASADRSQQTYYTAVRDSGNAYISSIYLSTATEDFCLTVSLPVFDAAGGLSSILVADINIAAMAMLSSLPAEPDAVPAIA